MQSTNLQVSLEGARTLGNAVPLQIQFLLHKFRFILCEEIATAAHNLSVELLYAIEEMSHQTSFL